MKLTVPDYISSITPYSPGKPLEELEREYGIRDSIKLASNENPLGPSPMAIAAIADALKDLNRYPDAGGHYLVRGISDRLGVEPGNVVLGNGSDEILGLLAQAFLSPGSEVILPRPSFLMYDILVRSAGAKAIYVPLQSLSIDTEAIADRVTENTRMVFLTNPNNPTGTIISKADFQRFLGATPPNTIVVIDEAYIEFVRDTSCMNSMDFFSEDRALVILRTFSKAYGLAGLRIGYGIMPIQIAELLNRIRLPFNANSLAQVGALAALQDEAFLQQSVHLVHEGLDFMAGAL
ncbi:MAG: histidinol-phosphate transaminase, partial [Desulfobacterales bacterium]